MTVATTPVEALEMGIEIIKEKGWTQGRLQDTETGAVCSIGALRAATHGFTRDGMLRVRGPKGAYQTESDAENFLTLALARRKVSVFDEDVVGYNDAPGRTKRQIISLFQSAIKAAKKAAGQ